MPNSLLDFVMSLVRDPDAAAHYAADPSGAIADANLTDVTTVDVNHLIPVVEESLSSSVPTIGADSFGADAANNVWTSGAATAAFDAFDAVGDHLPQQVIDDPGSLPNDLFDTAGPQIVDVGSTTFDVPTVAGVDDPGLLLDAPVLDELPVIDSAGESDWSRQSFDDHHLVPGDTGFEDLI